MILKEAVKSPVFRLQMQFQSRSTPPPAADKQLGKPTIYQRPWASVNLNLTFFWLLKNTDRHLPDGQYENRSEASWETVKGPFVALGL